MARLAKTVVMVVALVMLLAVINVGSASATRLCASPGVGAVCPEEDIIPNETPIKLALVGKAKFEIGFTKVECSSSFLGGELVNGGGAGLEVPVDVKFVNRSFFECGACEIEVIRPQWNGGFFGSGNRDGTLIFDNEFKFICGANWCVHEVLFDNEGIVKGGEPAKVEIKEQTLTLVAESAKICAKWPTWSATYEITTPSPLYVTEN